MSGQFKRESFCETGAANRKVVQSFQFFVLAAVQKGQRPESFVKCIKCSGGGAEERERERSR